MNKRNCLVIPFIIVAMLDCVGAKCQKGGAGGAGGGAGSSMYGFRFYMKSNHSKKDFFGKIFGLNTINQDDVSYLKNQTNKSKKTSSIVSTKNFDNYGESLLIDDEVSLNDVSLLEKEFNDRFVTSNSKIQPYAITKVYLASIVPANTRTTNKTEKQIYIDSIHKDTTTYIVTTTQTESTFKGQPDVPLASVDIRYTKKGNHDLKIPVYLKSLSPDGNMLTFNLWDYNNDPLPITSPDTSKYPFDQDSSFYYKINWVSNDPSNTHPKYHFNLPFYTKYLVPISTPITFLVGNDSKNEHRWQSNFLTAGMAYGWARGRTKFYKDNFYSPKNFYFGAGFFAAISATTIQAKDFNHYGQLTSGTSALDSNEYRALQRLTGGNITTGSYTAPLGELGMHIGVTVGPLQILGVYGWGWAFGYPCHNWAYQGKPFAGFGFGLSLFNLAVPGGV